MLPAPLRPALSRLLLPLWLLLAARVLAGQPWPHEGSDVPPDPAIRWGRLENGLRYAVRSNAEPAGRVYLILQVAAGSLHERDDQRGYAHFLEHMVFRGTRRFPGNSLVGLLQHEGLALGADNSAFTNFTTTFYNLDVPKNSPDKIALGLSVLRDFADGALLPKADLKREAKVVESERRTRESNAAQVGEEINAFLYAGSRLPQRLPIGTPASVAGATVEGLQEFYRTWYRPSRLTVIAVGDASPDLLERLVREQFGSLRAATPDEPPEADPGFPPPADGLQVHFVPNPVPGGTTTLLNAFALGPPEPDTRARRAAQVTTTAATSILNFRLAEIQRERSAEVGDAEAGWSLEFGRLRRGYVRVDTRPDLWRAGVRLAEQELRRALLHGFTADEVRLQMQAYDNGLKEAVRTAPSRNSAQLAHAIRNALEYNFVVTAPETDLEIAGPVVAALTPAACAEAFRALWAPANRRLTVIGLYPAPLTGPDLRRAYEESAYASFFSEKDARAIAPFDYTDFGPAGKIVRRTRDDRVDIHSVAFANGVRANVKETDYEKGRVQVRIRLGQGLLEEPAAQPGLGLLAEGSYIAGGLRRYDNPELGRRLAGDSLVFNFSGEEDGFFFTGASSPDKVEKLLQVITAFLTDPAFRPEGFQNAWSRLQAHYPNVARQPTLLLGAACPTALASGDSRYGLVPPEKAGQRKPAEVEAWLRPILAHAPIEVGVAGDCRADEVIAAIGRTLGALPERAAPTAPDRTRRPALPATSTHHVWLLDGGDRSKAAVRVYWPGVDDDDFRTSRRLQVLAEILNDRLRVQIREELGATYGPQSDVWGSRSWPGYGHLFVEIETAPTMADRVAALTLRTAADLVSRGITQDEFDRVIQPRLASLKQELRNNAYWTHHVLCRLQESPGRVSWPLTRNSDYQGMLKKEVEEVARRFLGSGRAYVFIARPK